MFPMYSRGRNNGHDESKFESKTGASNAANRDLMGGQNNKRSQASSNLQIYSVFVIHFNFLSNYILIVFKI